MNIDVGFFYSGTRSVVLSEFNAKRVGSKVKITETSSISPLHGTADSRNFIPTTLDERKYT